jgi:hypothetical protein
MSGSPPIAARALAIPCSAAWCSSSALARSRRASSSADLPLELGAQILHLVPSHPLLGQGLLVGGPKLLDAEPGGGERSLGLLERDPIGLGIDAEQYVASAHGLVLGDVDLDDAAGRLGRDRNLRLAHIGVVSLLETAAGDPVVAAAASADAAGATGAGDGLASCSWTLATAFMPLFLPRCCARATRRRPDCR